MDESAFSDYVAVRRSQLFRTACLLCGDPHRAEDVVQDARTRLCGAWDRVERMDDIDGYVHSRPAASPHRGGPSHLREPAERGHDAHDIQAWVGSEADPDRVTDRGDPGPQPGPPDHRAALQHGAREDGKVRTIKTRAAVVTDARRMGQVMVESFLSAHRGQMPGGAYRKRVTEWTPEVSARGWARALAEQADGGPERDVILVAEEDDGVLLGLVTGAAAEDDISGTVAEIGALYVLPDRQGQGIGSSLLSAAASCLAERGFTELHVCVLTANLPARAFYEAVGGREVAQRTVDEEGYLLPATVYAWPDIATLTSAGCDEPPTAS